MKPGKLHVSLDVRSLINRKGIAMKGTLCDRWVLPERIAETEDEVTCKLCWAIMAQHAG